MPTTVTPASTTPDSATPGSAAAESGADAARSERSRKSAPQVIEPAGRTVVLLPPLLNTRYIMGALYWHLRWVGYSPRLFSYPSWSRDIPENAQLLASYLRGLGEQEVDVVSFSLGGILLRWAVNHHELPVLRRVVMLGPPNQGSAMADWLDRRLGPGFPAIWGRAARQLRRGERGLAARAGLFHPHTEVGIIAGGLGTSRGFNPLIPGDNDQTVAVSETVLTGMKDFALVRSSHTLLPLLPGPRALTIKFLQTGRFRDRKAHQPEVEAESGGSDGSAGS